MKPGLRYGSAVAVVLAAGVLVRLGLASRDAGRHPDLDRIAQLSELDVDWSYDPHSGRLAFAHDSGQPGIFVLNTRAAAGPERLPIDLPWPRKPVLAPGGRWMLFHAYVLAEMTYARRLYLMDLETRQAHLLVGTGGNGLVLNPAFSPDGQRVAYERAWQQGQDWRAELHVRDLASGHDRALRVQRRAALPAWAADGRSLYVLDDGCLRRVDVLGGGAARELACVPGGEQGGSPPQPSPSGARVAFVVQLDGCPRIAWVEGETGVRWLDRSECALRPVWSPDGSALAYVAVQHGRRVPRVRGLDGTPRGDLGVGSGVAYRLAAEPGGTFLGLLATPGAPRSLWRLAAGQAPRLLHAPVAEDFARRVGVVPTVREFTHAGVTIPTLVFTPRSPSPPVPAVVWIHGGPREDISPRFYQELTYLTTAGVLVLAPNYRGSTGYGGAFAGLHDDREGQVGDVIAVIEGAVAIPGVDRERLFLVGESFGGLLATRAARARPDLVRGVVQWTGLPQGYLEHEGGGLPGLLWIHGREADYARFPVIARGLRARGVPVQRLELAHTTHAIYQADERARALQALRRFVGAGGR